MGWDIIIVTQVRRDGGWEDVPEVTYDTRCHPVFAILGGVGRDSEKWPQLRRHRGMPDGFEDQDAPDLPGMLRGCFEGCHHKQPMGDWPSWLTLAELEMVDWQAMLPAAGDFVNEFLPKLRVLGAPDDVRIVFGWSW